MRLRHLVIVLGDQLDGQSAAFDGFDPTQDAILQMEVREEATYIPQHKRRLAFFFASMRHFRDEQRILGRCVYYSEFDDPDNRGNFADEIRRWATALQPQRLVVLEPGDWRVRRQLSALERLVEFRLDRHFLCSSESFEAFAREHPRLTLEQFYRTMRRRLSILVEPDGKPTGGAWNYDKVNRASFGSKSPPPIPPPKSFAPDQITRDVLALVEREFPKSPGRLNGFDLPVTRDQALASLQDFTENRLWNFGHYQDAMHTGEPFLFHSFLSGPLNLHFLRPREVIDAVLANPADVPLNSLKASFARSSAGANSCTASTGD